MVNINSLNSYFYNRSNVSVSLSNFHSKTDLINKLNGVPRYTYSLSSNKEIPSSGIISLGDFRRIRCQTGCVAVETTAKHSIPQKRVTNHPNITLPLDGASFLHLVFHNRLIARVWCFWETQSSGDVFHYIQVEVREENRLYVAPNRYDFTSLGYAKRTLYQGMHSFGYRKLTFVIVEDLNFDV